jgi:hypothetical protein
MRVAIKKTDHATRVPWTPGKYKMYDYIGHADVPRLCLLRKTNKIARIIGTKF